jgi:pyruvate dehydrogenase E2 component (dihydrolipoamide acetyltransferase)
MAEVITMLALSPTMEEGTIAAWLKAEGESVEEGEIIAEIETDKATMEMESFFEGTVLKVLVKSGDTVPVGAPMAVIGEAGEDPQEALDEFGASGGGSGGSDSQADDASDSGSEDQAAQDTSEDSSSSAAPAASSSSDGKRIKASPLARRIAADNDLELSAVTGTGPGGRIIRADVEEALEAGVSSQSSAPTRQAAPAAPGEPIVVGEMPDASASFEPMSQMRKTIARRMTQVWQNTPFFYLTMEIDMGAAMAKRKEFNNDLAAAEVDAKISVNDMIVKACALALRDYPRMNTAFAGDELATFDQVHIGVAVALDEGLITPTLRDADKKSLVAISRETRELAAKARDKKLKPGEYGGSTFSISNLGMYGIDHFQAVINPPESGILACGAVQKVPVVEDGEITVGTRMKVTLTCDHRAVDGAIGAEFLRRVKKMLEHPTLLLI